MSGTSSDVINTSLASSSRQANIYSRRTSAVEKLYELPSEHIRKLAEHPLECL